MARISVLIGGLTMLFAHSLIITRDDQIGSILTTISIFGFLLVWINIGESGNGSSFNETETETFKRSWLDENGIYEGFFGYSLIGSIIMILIIIAMIIIIYKKDSPFSGWLLLSAAVMLFLFRIYEFNSSGNFFYESDGFFTYVEIPVGFVAGLISGLRNIKTS